jgi:hypothetical protein
MHVLHAELIKPEALDQPAWEAIQDPLNRLKTAVYVNDRHLIVGSAKDVVEATARVVLNARGQPAGSNEEYDKILGDAHRAIERQPGPGLAADAPVRQAATSAKKLAAQLRELRNIYGTGHGRSFLPVVEDEVLETCVDGALLWTRWALRRLQFLIIGSLQPLINDLRESTFGMGRLATRLQAANLPNLPAADQRLLGVAVGRRTALNTFTVRIDGVDACADSQDAVAWPPSYREGVAEGLFLDLSGQVHVDDNAIGARRAAEVLGPHPEQTRVLTDLEAKLRSAAWSPEFTKIWQRVVAEMHIVRNLLHEPGAQQSWSCIAEHFKQTGEGYETLGGDSEIRGIKRHPS